MRAWAPLLCALSLGLSQRAWATRCEVSSQLSLTLTSTFASANAWEDWPQTCAYLAPYLKTSTSAPSLEKRLLQTGYFSGVRCERSAQDAQQRCEVTPARLVADVELKGSLPFVVLEQDLLRRLALKPGALLSTNGEELRRQERRFEVYMEREGYFGTRVKIRVHDEGDAEPNLGVRLDIHVDTGWSTTLGEVRIRGVTKALRAQVEDKVRHPWFLFFGNERFRPARFDEDLEKITELLKDKGYPSARVKGRYIPDEARRAVDVELDIALGPKLLVAFEGNRALDNGDLKEELTFKSSGAVDEVEIESTRTKLIRLYQGEGFHRVKITASIRRPNPQLTVVRYTIVEGPRAKIEVVSIVGNDNVPLPTIEEEAELKTHDGRLFASGRAVEVWLERDRRAIASLYKKRGYGAVQVEVQRSNLDEGELAVRFVIREGPVRKVSEVAFLGLEDAVSKAELLEPLLLKPGSPFEERLVVVDRRRILAALAQRGYLSARVKQKVEAPPPEQAGPVRVGYEVLLGPRAIYGGALTRGNLRTSRGLLERKLSLTPGGPLDLVQVGAARRRLRAMGLFGSVAVQPLHEVAEGGEGGETWLLVSVEEREVRTLDGVLSFATDDLFSVGADYKDRNLFGQAITLDITTRLSNATGLISDKARIGRVDNIRARLLLPELYGLPFDINADIYYQLEDRQRFRDRRIGGGLGISRRLLSRKACEYCPDITGAFGYELVASKFTDKNEDGDPDEVQGRTTGAIARLVPSLTLDRRDSFVDPRRGYSAYARFEFAHKVLAGTLEAATNFLKVKAGAQGFLPLFTLFKEPLGEVVVFGGPLIFAVGANYGWLTPLQGEAIPLSETFFYGGDADVRGLARGASLGEDLDQGAFNMVVGTAELRWYILQNFGFGDVQLAGFVDVGTVAESITDLFSNTTVSAGPAIRYVTPVGPLSFSYAWPLLVDPNIQRDAAPSRGRFHFTFGYTF